MAASTSIALVRTNAANAIATWAEVLRAATEAGGFVQTADTGQADFSTLTTPVAINTASGYRVYRSDDGTGLGLNDFYFKVEVGSGSNVNNPAIWWTFGWGSDGAGTITNTAGGGVTSRVQQLNSASTALDSYFSATTGHLSIAMWGAETASAYNLISVERLRDESGAALDVVWPYINNQSTNMLINQLVPRTAGIATNNTLGMNAPGSGWNYILPAQATYGADKGVSLLFPMMGSFRMPSLNLFAGNSSDFPGVAQSHSITAYGATHTYITLGGTTAPTSGQRMIMRYE